MTGPGSGEIDQRVSDAFVAACLAELDALKPGNVHVHAPGHGMDVEDFQRSARAAAPAIARRGTPVGLRIRDAVAATFEAVGQNTNLGILLLAAPIAVAFERGGNLLDALRTVLAGTTVEDAALAFEAIRIANPGGLGRAAEGDVADAPEITLTAAMALAAERDRIARQYVNGFADIVGVGLAAFRQAAGAGWTAAEPIPVAATEAVYMGFVTIFPDTHVARKHGLAAAEATRQRFVDHLAKFGAADRAALLGLDAALKAERINPGTSADLTVATLFLSQLL